MSFSLPTTWARPWHQAVSATLLLGSLLLGGLAPRQAHAQPSFVLATTPDARLADAADVTNTGADEIPLNTDFLRVMCWDGQQPSFGWSLDPYNRPGVTGQQPLLGASVGQVTDPDIVLNPAGRATDVLIVYLLDGAPTYEVWQYDASSNTVRQVTRRPVRLDKYGSNPNVDVNAAGQAVITYANKGAIFAYVYDMPSRRLYGQNVVAYDPGYELSQPDVAVSVGQSDYPNTSFIYLATDGRQQSVRVVQFSTMQLLSGSVFNQNIGTDVLPNYGGPYDAPRICGPVAYPGFQPNDFEAVVNETGTNRIIGLNFNSFGASYPTFLSPNNLPTDLVLNDQGSLSKLATCSKPVVTYCGDAIEVAWTLEDGTLAGNPAPPVFGGDREVVRVELSWFGNIFRGDYALVDEQLPGDQYVPSVAGRYSAFLNTGGVGSTSGNRLSLYCFYSEATRSIEFKSCDYDAYSLRTAGSHAAPGNAPRPPQAASQFTAAPNPFELETVFTLPLAEQETVQSLTVHDMTGRLVGTVDAADLKGEVRWNAAGLPAGLYLARLRTSSGATYTYRLNRQ